MAGDNTPPRGTSRGPGPDVCTGPAAPQAAEPSARQDEAVALIRMAAGLKTAYPSVDAAIVDAAIATAHGTFQQAKIRTYVPILVERRVRYMLGASDREAGSPASAAERGSAPSLPTTPGTSEQSSESTARSPLRSRWLPKRFRPPPESDVRHMGERPEPRGTLRDGKRGGSS